MVPGRTSRWVIGLVVTGVLALLSLASLWASLSTRAEVLTDGRNPAVYPTYTARSMATVLDVAEDPGLPGRLRTTVVFVLAGGERMSTYVTWPEGYPPPRVGDEFEVAYDPRRPDHAADGAEVLRYAEQAGGLDRVTAEELPSLLPGLVAGGLAGLALGGTVLWATRGPRRASP